MKEGEEEEKEESKRCSKDGVLNSEGKRLVEFLEEKGLGIMNGDIKGDEKGEFTFTGGRWNTVIDYVIGGEDVRGWVGSLKIGDKIDSDHHPVEVYVKGKQESKREGVRNKSCRGVWNEEGRNIFKEKVEGIGGGNEELSIEDEWGIVESRLKEALRETERCMGKRDRGEGKWWDEECRSSKREVRKVLRNWRREGGEGEKYKDKKRAYKKLCEKKKKEDNERWERRVAKAKRESDVWEIVNRERKRRGRINEDIGMDD